MPNKPRETKGANKGSSSRKSKATSFLGKIGDQTGKAALKLNVDSVNQFITDMATACVAYKKKKLLFRNTHADVANRVLEMLHEIKINPDLTKRDSYEYQACMCKSVLAALEEYLNRKKSVKFKNFLAEVKNKHPTIYILSPDEKLQEEIFTCFLKSPKDSKKALGVIRQYADPLHTMSIGRGF